MHRQECCADVFNRAQLKWAGSSFARTLPMIKQSERSAFGYPSKTKALGVDYEPQVASKRGRYFAFPETAVQIAASKFAWAGVMVSIAGSAALFLLWTQNEPGPANATGANASSTLSAAPQVVTRTAAAEMEELRQRGLELLRTEFPEDAPSPPLPRGDRLELNGPTLAAAPQVATQTSTVEELRLRGLELLRTESPQEAPSSPLARGDRLQPNDGARRPDMLVATAGQDESVAAPPPSPVPIAASPRPEAKVSKPEKVKERAVESPVHRRHARYALAHRRDRVRMANANYVQARRREPLPTTVPVEENSGAGTVAPWSSWKNDWDKLWSKGTEGK